MFGLAAPSSLDTAKLFRRVLTVHDLFVLAHSHAWKRSGVCMVMWIVSVTTTGAGKLTPAIATSSLLKGIHVVCDALELFGGRMIVS